MYYLTQAGAPGARGRGQEASVQAIDFVSSSLVCLRRLGRESPSCLSQKDGQGDGVKDGWIEGWTGVVE